MRLYRKFKNLNSIIQLLIAFGILFCIVNFTLFYLKKILDYYFNYYNETIYLPVIRQKNVKNATGILNFLKKVII